MRLRNKILLTIGSIILIIILIIMNLRTYSPYYAMHMPKPEGAHPEVYFALLNLDDIHKPESDDYVYKTRNFNRYMKAIGVYSDGEWQCGMLIKDGFSEECITGILQSNSSYRLYFNRNFYVTKVKNRDDFEEITISNEKKEELRQDLLKILKPIFDKQKKPLFNWQWLFNWIYGDFVNG